MDVDDDLHGLLKMLGTLNAESAFDGVTIPIHSFIPLEPVDMTFRIDSAGGYMDGTQSILGIDRLAWCGELKVQVDDDEFKIVEIHDRAEAVRRGKHCGWCTARWDNTDYVTRYQKNFGRLFVLYRLKDGNPKRRPSYQLFVSKQGNVEFQKKGAISVDPWAFIDGLSNQTLKAKLLALLPCMKTRHMGRSMASTYALIQQRIDQVHEDCAVETIPRRKSFKKFKPLDQLIQSRLAKSGCRVS